GSQVVFAFIPLFPTEKRMVSYPLSNPSFLPGAVHSLYENDRESAGCRKSWLHLKHLYASPSGSALCPQLLSEAFACPLAEQDPSPQLLHSTSQTIKDPHFQRHGKLCRTNSTRLIRRLTGGRSEIPCLSMCRSALPSLLFLIHHR